MFDLNAGAQINNVGVTTSDNGGLSTEQIMEMAINKIMFLSKDAPPAIREQAEAFRQNLKQVLFYHLNLGILSSKINFYTRGILLNLKSRIENKIFNIFITNMTYS